LFFCSFFGVAPSLIDLLKGAVRAADREGPLGRGDQLLSEPSVVYTESKLSCTRGRLARTGLIILLFLQLVLAAPV
jgi:hypothetical protein